MHIAALLIATLLALYGSAAGVTTSAACCLTNTTLFVTSTVTINCPKTMLYVTGNVSTATGVRKTYASLVASSVISSLTFTHTDSDPAYDTVKNATEMSAGSIMTRTAVGNATLPKTNMTKTCTTGSTSLLPSTTKDLPRITKALAPIGTSLETGNSQASQSQVGTTTTLTKETTITHLPTFTCTIGEPCSYHDGISSFSGLGASYTVANSAASSNASPDSTVQNSTAYVLLTSSTMTRTVTLKSSAGVFAGVTSLTSETVMPVTSSSTTSTQPSGHSSTFINTKDPDANNTSIAGSSTASASIVLSSTTRTSTTSISIMKDSTVSASISSTLNLSIPTAITSTGTGLMTNMSTAGATSNIMTSSSSLMSPSSSSSLSSSTSSSLLSSTSSMVSTISSSAISSPAFILTPTSSPPSSSTVIIVPFTSIIVASFSNVHASPPRFFTMMLHLFSYVNLASAEFTITTVRTTTVHPVTTITTATTGCDFHPDSQGCMTNLGYNNAGVRPNPPFVTGLLANLIPAVYGHLKRADTISSSSTVTVTRTVLDNQDNGNVTPVPTSTEIDYVFTPMGTSAMSIPPKLDFSSAGSSLMSISPTPGSSMGTFTSMGSSMGVPVNSSICVPFCNVSGGIVASDTPTPSNSGRPAASGEASKGALGGFGGGWGIVLGLL